MDAIVLVLFVCATFVKHNGHTKMSIANENEQENPMYIFSSKRPSRCIFLDLTKAFDTSVQHPILANNEVITTSMVFSGSVFN